MGTPRPGRRPQSTIADTLATALEHHRAGRLAAAESL